MSPDATAIAIVRDNVEAWRRENDYSRETAAQCIVEAHERLGFDKQTGIRFDPPTRDAYERQRVNADRIYRWLDDSTKDKNLLPFNFLRSILAALPMERRLVLMDTLLAPVQIGAHEEDIHLGIDLGSGQDASVVAIVHFRDVASTTADASVEISKMVDGIGPGEAEAAKVKISRARAALKRAGAFCARVLHLQRRKAA